jgi:hypothetical protein
MTNILLELKDRMKNKLDDDPVFSETYKGRVMGMLTTIIDDIMSRDKK